MIVVVVALGPCATRLGLGRGPVQAPARVLGEPGVPASALLAEPTAPPDPKREGRPPGPGSLGVSSEATPAAATLGAIHGRVVVAGRGPLSEAERLAGEVALYFDLRRPGLDESFGFTFDGLEPGLHALRLRVPGFQPIDGVSVRVRAGETNEVELVLCTGATLVGRALDEDGRPLEGVRVAALVTPPNRSTLSVDTSTNEFGEFRLAGVPGGEGWIQASAPDFRLARADLSSLSETETRTGLELVLARGNTIAGRVRGPDGSPSAGATIEIRSEAPGSWDSAEPGCRADGSFHASGFGAGPFRVWAWSQEESGSFEVACARGVRAGTTDLELRLSRPGRIELAVDGDPEIEVRDLDGLEPGPEQYFMGIDTPEERPSMHERREGGRRVIDGLTPGEYCVLATDHAARTAGWTQITVHSDATEYGSVVLRPATSLSARVLLDLQPVRVRSADGFAWRLEHQRGVATEQGGFTKVGQLLPAGTYRVECERSGRPAVELVLSGQPECSVDLE